MSDHLKICQTKASRFPAVNWFVFHDDAKFERLKQKWREHLDELHESIIYLMIIIKDWHVGQINAFISPAIRLLHYISFSWRFHLKHLILQLEDEMENTGRGALLCEERQLLIIESTLWPGSCFPVNGFFHLVIASLPLSACISFPLHEWLHGQNWNKLYTVWGFHVSCSWPRPLSFIIFKHVLEVSIMSEK